MPEDSLLLIINVKLDDKILGPFFKVSALYNLNRKEMIRNRYNNLTTVQDTKTKEEEGHT